jgi:hypothetical protein
MLSIREKSNREHITQTQASKCSKFSQFPKRRPVRGLEELEENSSLIFTLFIYLFISYFVLFKHLVVFVIDSIPKKNMIV